MLWREEMKMFVYSKTVLGQRQVEFGLPLLYRRVFGCRFRKNPGPAFLVYASHTILVLASEYCDRYAVFIDLCNSFI